MECIQYFLIAIYSENKILEDIIHIIGINWYNLSFEE